MIQKVSTQFQDSLYLQKYSNILGMDEAGRGPWAGSVVMAGIILTSKSIQIKGVDDSKKLTSAKREELYEKIINTHNYSIVSISAKEIDKIGIGHALIKGYRQIIDNLPAEYILIDGYFKKEYFRENVACITKGDNKMYAIAAASILAKYTRDKEMEYWDLQYPRYNFKVHKGYGTMEHTKKITEFGICAIHRMSYQPMKNLSQFKKSKNKV